VKQSIVERNLWELCERRCRAYPALLNGLKQMVNYSAVIEKYDPATKHPFFYLSGCSAHRPEVLRYANRLDRFTLAGNVLITTIPKGKETDVAEEESFDHVFFVKPPFGPLPVGLKESYPAGQAEIPTHIDEEAKTVALQNVLKLLKLNREVKFVFCYDSRWEGHPLIGEIREYAEVKAASL
jgi:7-cyano-7-deazaguanine tRNA-ribosyltransferase